jgi:hypothetical protein
MDQPAALCISHGWQAKDGRRSTEMSTSYTQALHLPRSRQANLMIGGLLAAAVLVAAVGVTVLAASRGSTIEGPAGAATAFERIPGRGDMEYPGIQAPAVQPKPGPAPGYRTQTPRGGLAELAGLEMAPAAAAHGEARGGLQEYAQTR